MPETFNKRVVVIHWKKADDILFEVFSNLKNLCQNYPEFNYNTLNNYLSRAKRPYENDEVRIERKNVISPSSQPVLFERIAPIVKRTSLKEANESSSNLDYWHTQPVAKRLAAVTFLISQSLKPGERMNKKMVRKIPMKS